MYTNTHRQHYSTLCRSGRANDVLRYQRPRQELLDPISRLWHHGNKKTSRMATNHLRCAYGYTCRCIVPSSHCDPSHERSKICPEQTHPVGFTEETCVHVGDSIQNESGRNDVSEIGNLLCRTVSRLHFISSSYLSTPISLFYLCSSLLPPSFSSLSISSLSPMMY